MVNTLTCITCEGKGYVSSPLTKRFVYCPCCGGLTSTSLERHLQFLIGGNVLLLEHGVDASTDTMNERILYLVREECARLNRTPPALKPWLQHPIPPEEVVKFFTNQLVAEDCFVFEHGRKRLVNPSLFINLPPLPVAVVMDE